MDAIILAAGLSTRMGKNKLLLPFGSSTVLNAVIEKAEPFADRIIVVLGNESDRVRDSITSSKVTFALNPDYEKGQLTSTLCGIRASIGDFFILPGDIPRIAYEDIESTIRLLNESTTARCFYKEIPGHPVSFREENRDKILSYPGTIRNYLREIPLSQHQGTIGSVFDADTSLRYEALLASDMDPALLDA